MNRVKLFALAVSVSLTGFAGCTSADNTGSDDSSSSDDAYSSQTDSSSSMDKQISSSSSSLNSSSSSSSEDISSSSSNGVSSSGTSSPNGSKGNDIANYKTKKIGEQTWMAENLDYAVEGSKCYNNLESNCVKYGRLYDWATAMALSSSCNSDICSSLIQTKHKGVCPSGWHIPSNAEWDQLYRFADGTSGTSSPYESTSAGKHLKEKDGWNYCGPSGSGKSYSCEDTYGFTALPGGGGYSGGSFGSVGDSGHWWTASEGNSSNAYYRSMYYNYERTYWGNDDKYYLFSVRCLQD
jgi:uncharacterized protein (TIGR02145 family)